jgi:ABC-2 type transport system permease protein
MRLLGVELTRVRWRRACLVLLVASVLVPAVIWAGTVWGTRPYSDAEVQRATEQAQAQPGYDREVRRCERKPEQFLPPEQLPRDLAVDQAQVADRCQQLITQWWTGLYREPLDLRRELDGSGTGIAVVMAGLLMLLGATFVGADWASGSMSNQLLFEPRRLRVYAAKAGAVVVTGLLLGLAVGAAWWLGLAGVARARDLPVADGVTGDIVWQVVRGALLVAGAGLAGLATTMLFRSTVATLGILFAVVVAGTFLIAVLPFEAPERWMPHLNVAAWIADGATYWTDNAQTCVDDGTGVVCTGERILTAGAGAAYLLSALGLVAAGSLATFTRRDIP